MTAEKQHSRLAFGTGIPDSFAPHLGRIMVQFAFMDTELQKAIMKLRS